MKNRPAQLNSQFFIRNSKFEILLAVALLATHASADSLPILPEESLAALPDVNFEFRMKNCE